LPGQDFRKFRLTFPEDLPCRNCRKKVLTEAKAAGQTARKQVSEENPELRNMVLPPRAWPEKSYKYLTFLLTQPAEVIYL